MSSVTQALHTRDVSGMGLIKPFVLGFVIVTTACHVGLRTKGGTQGVGEATTVAVVTGSVAVIAVDFFVTKILIALMDRGQGAECGRVLSDPPNEMDTQTTQTAEEILNERGAPVVMFDQVQLAFDEKVVLKNISFTLISGTRRSFSGRAAPGSRRS